MNRRIYKQVAKLHGVSIKEVKRDMQAAIDVAYKNPNAFAQGIVFKGYKPTINEVVAHAVSTLKTTE